MYSQRAQANIYTFFQTNYDLLTFFQTPCPSKKESYNILITKQLHPTNFVKN